MHILTLGLNHHTAPVAVRERVALGGERLAVALAATRGETREAVILATCNRTELYAVTAHVDSGARALRRVLAAVTMAADGDLPAGGTLESCLYEHVDGGTVRHLLRVAAGLDSLVVGEPQILGQVREAFDAALAAGTTGPILAQLPRTALSAGKEARTVTDIARGATSISHAAVELARKECQTHDRGLRDRAVLVIGAGKMATLAAIALAGHGARVTVLNRTAARAAALAERLGGQAQPFDQLPHVLAGCDIVIASTGATEPVITPALLGPVLPLRAGRPLLLLDIAVPRNIDPASGTLPGVTLRNIDDLQRTVAAGVATRAGETAKVEAILDRHAATFWDWYRAREVAPTIAALRDKAEAIRDAELAKTLARLGHLDERDRNAITALSVAIANKLLHEPTTRLKHPGDGGDFVVAVAELFGLPKPAQERSDGGVGEEAVTVTTIEDHRAALSQ